MTYQIQNEQLSIGIKQKGAELSSIQSRATGIEYLWQANPSFWGRHSCILFPIIGEVSDKHILVENKKYALKRHGFVRDMNFKLNSQNETEITLLVSSDANTLAIYPYSFQFLASYKLEGTVLAIQYTVINQNQHPIHFSLGAHPGFNCPVLPGEKRSDYALIFNKKENAYTQLLNDHGLRKEEKRLVLDNDNVIPLTEELFDEDALIFHNLNSNKVTLVNRKKEKPVLSFDFSGFPYLGIWSKNRQSPFVCIEPWHGVADKIGPKTEFKEKAGVITLDAGKQFECVHKIEILH